MTRPFETLLLDDVVDIVGGLRTSASSNADLIPLLKQTNDAVKDLARDQANKGSDSSSMLPMMMMMMRR